VHLTPKAWAFFTLAISEQNFAFAKSSLAFGAGDSHVGLTLRKNQIGEYQYGNSLCNKR
jgi:hypothetical protein